MKPGRVLIIGAGLAGSLLAVYLARAGWKVELVERRADPRARRLAVGRSINLAISARGLQALRRAGLEDTVLKDAIRMRGRTIHPVAGETHFHPYSSDPTLAINSVSRSALNLTLLDAAAAEPNVTLAFEERCTGVDPTRAEATFVHDAMGTTRTVTADLIVGTDGAYSAARAALQKSERFDYSQDFLGHGYKELTIPPVTVGPHAPFAMEPNALHIWPRGESMMIALPNPDGSFTCTLFWRHDGDGSSFAAIRTAADATTHFQSVYPDAVPMMPTLGEEFERNPRLCRSTARVRMRALKIASRFSTLSPTNQPSTRLSRVTSAIASRTRTRSPTWRSTTLWRCVIWRVVRRFSAGRRSSNSCIAWRLSASRRSMTS
jgi:kynurenine 3-monooxygenase